MSLATSIRLAVGCCVAAVWLTDVSAREEAGNTSQLGILRQAEGLPKEFDEHFFDVPLAVRVDLDRGELHELDLGVSEPGGSVGICSNAALPAALPAQWLCEVLREVAAQYRDGDYP